MSLCFFVMATEKYQRYIPLFSYFCFKSYPGCGVRILLSGCKLDHEYVASVKILEGMGDFKMRTVMRYPRTSKEESRMLRWVWSDEGFFDPYENVYITDIDMIICWERPSLEEHHLEHCRKTGLPYSNVVRDKSRRFTGNKHFVRRKEYYEAMMNVLDKYSKFLKKGKLRGYNDEELLYTMIEESKLGFPGPGTIFLNHGIHLGLWRGKKEGKGLKAFKAGIIPLASYEKYFSFYWSLRQDSLFKRINEDRPLKELERMERWKEREWDTRKGVNAS